MKIVEVNYTDLAGRIFNGYDLHLTLNQVGDIAHQIVKNKHSNTSTVIELKNNILIDKQLENVENIFSMSNMLLTYGKQLQDENCFINADIIHYHILHNSMISLLDLPLLMRLKPSVWTIHDPWMITGNCVYPLECRQWLDGCHECSNLNYKGFEMKNNKAHQMWNIKKEVYKNLEVDLIVSSSFMRNYIEKSPLTDHMRKIHIIPFGVCVADFDKINKVSTRMKYKILKEDFVIGFRSEENYIKGSQYVYQVLRELEEITFAPECGIAVEYGSSSALKYAIERLMKFPDECRERGIKGRKIVE